MLDMLLAKLLGIEVRTPPSFSITAKYKKSNMELSKQLRDNFMISNAMVANSRERLEYLKEQDQRMLDLINSSDSERRKANGK